MLRSIKYGFRMPVYDFPNVYTNERILYYIEAGVCFAVFKINKPDYYKIVDSNARAGFVRKFDLESVAVTVLLTIMNIKLRRIISARYLRCWEAAWQPADNINNLLEKDAFVLVYVDKKDKIFSFIIAPDGRRYAIDNIAISADLE